MSRRAKGPRLWLHPSRKTWFILDTGNIQRGTGCDAADRARAEIALAQYVRSKHTKSLNKGLRDPSQIEIADVINLYLKNVAPHRARSNEIVDRLLRVSEFFGTRRLDYITGATCRAYVEQRSTSAASRRELEDLRAAINHHRSEGLHDRLVSVTLPPRQPRRERWLTKQEAAQLILAAWRYRERQNHRATERATRKHVARFMVVARYMGSRAGVICGASIEDKRPAGRAWVDLRTGIFYGRAVGERETKKRKQTMRMPSKLLAHMRRWRKRGQRYVVEWNHKPVTRINKAHRAVVADVGLGPDVTPHVWRHSVATWLMEKGMKAKEVADWLAMSETTLLRVYRHHQPTDFADIHGAL